MAKPKKQIRIERLISRLRSGNILYCELEAGQLRYWTEPDGKSVGPVTVKKAEEAGLIEPAKDGLIETFNQTWVLK